MKKVLELISRQLPIEKPKKSVTRILKKIMDIQQSLMKDFHISESHGLLQEVIENDPSAIALLDKELRYIFVSKRFLIDYDVKETDILGKKHYEVFPDLPQIWKDVHQRALSGEVVRAEEDSFQRSDGNITWVRWECRPWYDDEGGIGGIILYTEVITRQKESEFELIMAKEKAEASEKSMSDVLDKLNEAQHIAKIGSWDWNIITGVVWWSDELYEIFELDQASYKPSFESSGKFIHPEDFDEYNKGILNSLKTGDPFNHQLRIITQNGNLKICKSAGFVYFDKNRNAVEMRGTFSDITDNVRILNELNAAKEKAEESDRLKTAFLQNMSHEVRTPLNSIVGFSELLSEPGQSLQKIKSFSKIISSNSNKLIGIVSDMIEISQIQSKQIRIVLSKFDVVPLLYKVSDPFREITQLKEIDFFITQDIPSEKAIIESDKGKVEKIFYHLIDNAVKFTHKGAIRAELKIENNNLIFSISDDGIGIEEDKQNIIFDPFRQLETGLSRSYGGTGLGLTIVKAYVDALHGSISLKSELNKGTAFTVVLPVKINREKVPADIKNGADDDPVNTILIAEDEYSNFKYLYEVLHSDKMVILHANNGKEAIEICRNSNDIKMILMDIKMPVMDGASAARLIKEFRPYLPIIAQTAYVAEEDKNNSVFDDLIAKPINKSDLKQKMSKYINV
jgi:PAS domain S-box-containing protein